MDDLPACLPEDTRETYQRLLKEKAATRHQLGSRVKAYIALIERAATNSPLLDLRTARTLGESLLDLVDLCPEEYLRHLQAAIAYFLHSDDAEHDFDSVVGFEDDVEVYNAVCHHIGRADLRIEQ